jgi:hypothetical protein
VCLHLLSLLPEVEDSLQYVYLHLLSLFPEIEFMKNNVQSYLAFAVNYRALTIIRSPTCFTPLFSPYIKLHSPRKTHSSRKRIG